MKRCSRFEFLVVLFLFAAILPASRCLAQPFANDLDGTRWEFTLSTSINVATAGKVVAISNPAFEFFNGNEFRILDETDMEFLSGTYTIDAKGKAVLVPDPVETQQFLYSLIWDVIDSNIEPGVQINFSPTDVDISKMTFTALLKTKGDLKTLTMKANAKAKVTAQVTDDVGTETMTRNVSLVVAGVAYQDLAAYDASSWDFPAANAKTSVAGFDALIDTPDFVLILDAKPAGPSDSLSIFEITDNQNIHFSGTYLRNKNKVTFFFDASPIEQYMEDFVIQKIQQQTGFPLDSEDIWIDVTNIKSAGSIKKEQSIRFSAQAAVTCHVIINNELRTLKGSLSIKGTGTKL